MSKMASLKNRATVSPSGCWVWNNAKNKAGYGIMAFRGEPALTHRVMWELACGPIPKDTPCVLHQCDNPPCINPMHLMLGTRADNNHDKYLKGRGKGPSGESNGKTTLTNSDVDAIRADYASGTASTVALANRYGISKTTTARIVNGTVWKSRPVAGGPAVPYQTIRPGEKNANAKLTADQVMEIRASFARGDRKVRIAERYGVTRTLIGYIINRKTWRHI